MKSLYILLNVHLVWNLFSSYIGLIVLGYVPGSKQEQLKQSEGLDELDMLILRGQRLAYDS